MSRVAAPFTVTGIPEWARRARGQWKFSGSVRPDFAEVPRPHQESVWDYPRPPRVEGETRPVVIRLGRVPVAESLRCLRVLETASPPTYYVPPGDVRMDLLVPAAGESHCEWKGVARYFDLIAGGVRLAGATWSYPEPFAEFEKIRNYVAFYPDPLSCRVGELLVRRQPGEFYGGWLTDDLAGPFKGEPGSEAW